VTVTFQKMENGAQFIFYSFEGIKSHVSNVVTLKLDFIPYNYEVSMRDRQYFMNVLLVSIHGQLRIRCKAERSQANLNAALILFFFKLQNLF
jgi:hypothetical protein